MVRMLSRTSRQHSPPLPAGRKGISSILGFGALFAVGIAIGLVSGGVHPPSVTGQNADLNGDVTAGKQPNVVFITLESLPANRLPCYGYHRNTTPSLCRFAENATLYERAYSPSSWTMQSLPAISTGKYPFQLGATRRFVKVPDDERLIPEYLQEKGYRTHYYKLPKNPDAPIIGMKQGYDSRLVPEQLAAVLDRREAPVYARIHLWDTHRPYYPIPSYTEDNEFRFVSAEDVPNRSFLYRNRTAGVSPLEEVHRRRGQQFISDLYDETLLSTDRHRVANILDSIRTSGEFNNTLIVVTSDHGELLGRNSVYGHPIGFHGEQLFNVPLIVKFPGQKEGRIHSGLVSTIDIFATVLNIAGVTPPRDIPSHNLRKEAPHDRVFLYREAVSMVTPSYRVTRCGNDTVKCEGEYALFRYSNGSFYPASNETLTETLGSQMDAYLHRTSVKPPNVNSSEREQLRRRLEDLGYLQ